MLGRSAKAFRESFGEGRLVAAAQALLVTPAKAGLIVAAKATIHRYSSCE
jgi:hypothetical protein